MLSKASPILKAAASPLHLAKGRVNVIELSNLKKQAGERWPRISEGVYARIESLLKAKLGPNDLFVRIGDFAYLVTMPTTEPDDVNAICMRVAFDLHMSFLGQCGLDQIEVNIASAGEDDSLVLKRLPIEKVVQLVDKAGIQVSSSHLAGLLAKNSEQLGGSIQATPAEAATTVAVGYVYSRDAPPPRTLIIEFQFVPIWSVRHSAVTTYACEPKKVMAAGRREALSLARSTPKERIQIDTSAFQDGIDHLARCQKTRFKFLLAVQISFEVLGSPSGRMDFMATCRDLSQEYRNFMTFNIIDVPPGVAQSRLANMVTTLRPFGRGVSATLAPTQRVFASYQSIGLQAIGFDLREFTPKTFITQNDVEQLAQFARQFGLGTFLWNVQDKSVLKFAQDANIELLSGPAVAPAAPEPHGMWRLSWTDILARPDIEIWG